MIDVVEEILEMELEVAVGISVEVELILAAVVLEFSRMDDVDAVG